MRERAQKTADHDALKTRQVAGKKDLQDIAGDAHQRQSCAFAALRARLRISASTEVSNDFAPTGIDSI
jgi:hypothetical protein